MAYGHSPFEVEGSSVVLAVQNGQYRFPQNDKVYTQGLRDLISYMLVVDKSKRPNIHQVSRNEQAFFPFLLDDGDAYVSKAETLHNDPDYR